MKQAISKIGTAAALALLTAGAGAAPIIVSFTPSAQHVNVGDSVVVEMWISGLGDEILSGFDLNVRYNAALLNWTFITYSSAAGELGSNYGAAPLFDFDSFVNGDVGAQASALEDDATVAANQSNSFLIASFTLDALADGSTSFSLGSDLDFERNFVGLDALSLDVTVQGACVAIGQGSCARVVPEPASFGLAGLALIGAGIPAWRRRRNAAA